MARTDFEMMHGLGAVTSQFLVEVDGVDIGRFTEVTGLQVELEVETYTEGGVNGFVHHLPGRMTWPNLVLKRGVTDEDNLLRWFHQAAGDNFVAKGKVERSTAAITLLGADGDRLRTWNLTDAIPIRWTGPTLATASAEAPTEELEVAHHGFKAETF